MSDIIPFRGVGGIKRQEFVDRIINEHLGAELVTRLSREITIT
jgi:hypothetical protein